MRARKITGAEPTPIGAPPNWREEENGHCTALFVRKERLDGIDFLRSAWEGDDGDIIRQLAGAGVVLGVSAPEHPVVHMVVSDLPDVFDPVLVARRFTAPNGDPMVRVEMLYPNNGGSRVTAKELIATDLGAAIARGVARIEAHARKEGWIT